MNNMFFRIARFLGVFGTITVVTSCNIVGFVGRDLPDSEVPTPPTNLTAVLNDDGAVLEWTSGDNVSAHSVQRARESLEFTEITTTTGDATTATDAEIASDDTTPTYYRVCGVSGEETVGCTEPELLVPDESSDVPEEDGLVAEYLFDGDVTDSSGNDNNGTANGGLTYGTGADGTANAAVSLDGVNDFIEISNLGLDFPLTVAANIYVDDFDETVTLYASDEFDSYWGRYYGFSIRITTDGAVYSHAASGTTTYRRWDSDDNAISSGTWHTVTAVFTDFDTFNLYIDGSTVSVTEFNRNNPTDVDFQGYDDRIGRDYDDDGDLHFDGKIDSFRIYDRALSESEITG